MHLMSISVGGGTARRREPSEHADLASPAATRAAVRRLRDPRLWAGVLVVALSATVGGRVLAAADDTVQLWSATRDLPVGARVEPGDVAATSVHFADVATADGYLSVDASIVGRHLEQPVGAGQLIPSAALGSGAAPISELPVGVAAADLPPDLAVGDRVDVWALPDEGQGGEVARVIRDVRVAAVGDPELAVGGGDHEVLLAIESPADVAAALRGLAAARVVLVRVGG
jgi:hypothetical protein